MDAVGVRADDPEIVRDEQYTHLVGASEPGEKGEDLGCHERVEPGCRLVGNQQPRLGRERDCDHHPLALTAGETVRVIIHPRVRTGDAHLAHQFERARSCVLGREVAVEANGLGNLRTHCV